MLRNNHNRKSSASALKICGLGLALLIQTGCGGGDQTTGDVGIEDVAIAYIKRPTPRDNMGNIATNDLRIPVTFTAGGDLYLQTRATPNSPVKNITDRITHGKGDVQGVSVSYDGNKLVFSLRLEDPIPNDTVIPNWYLYEYDIPNDTITQLTSAGTDNGDDISPAYLPNGNIIFSSNRQVQSKALLQNVGEDKYITSDENHVNPGFKLHVLNRILNTIEQVTFNPSHDLDPTILSDSGRVLFSRWNHMGSRDNVSLYTMNPDGTDIRMYYGAHSYRTGQNPATTVHLTKAREMEDGRILAIQRPFITNFGGGDIVFIDGKNFADNTQPTWEQKDYVSGTAQTVIKQNIANPAGLALQGRYNAIFPMSDGSNRYLMSWSECKIMVARSDGPGSVATPCSIVKQNNPAALTDPNVVEAPPAYGLYLVDSDSQIPLVKPQADTVFSEIVMAYPRKLPPTYPQAAVDIDNGLAANNLGVLDIRSVYDFDNQFKAYGKEADLTDIDNHEPIPKKVTINSIAKMADPINTTADQRPARFIRIIKRADIPLRSDINLANSAFGVSTQQGMREIIGYAPIEPDGSVKIKVPADVPLSLSILDKDGRRISQRHQYWFQVKPGETLKCIGCHTHDPDDNDSAANLATYQPHGRKDIAYSLNQGSTTPGEGFPNSLDALWAQAGETMAETRAHHNDCSPNPAPCDVMKPSIDLIYDDVWTDDVAANRSTDASFKIDYSDVVSPASGGCANGYADTPSFTYCRVVINYLDHIKPIWKKTRSVGGADATCISCHTLTNTTEPYGQLELTSSASDQQPNHVTSYEELLRSDIERNMDGTEKTITVTRDILINGQPIDLNMDGINDTETVTIPDPDAKIIQPTMSTGGALKSRVFMELMTGKDLDNNPGNQPTDTKNHNLMLTPSELKLISEWLDIGAQYFNNPKDSRVPTN